MDDEPKVQQLENRINSLESTIEKMMPSRRDALKMGGAALVGGAAMSGTASAGTNQVGTIGSASQPVDLESEDINNADTVTTDTLDVNNIDLDKYTIQSRSNQFILGPSSNFSRSNIVIQQETIQADGTQEKILNNESPRASGLLVVVYSDPTDQNDRAVELVLQAALVNYSTVATIDSGLSLNTTYDFVSGAETSVAVQHTNTLEVSTTFTGMSDRFF